MSTILYGVNQLVGSQLWDSSFCPIFIFSMNKYLEDDAKNIMCSLYWVAAFIRVPHSISPRLSKKVLENSKFHKDKSKANTF